MEKFSLKVDTSNPYKEWAKEYARLYREGFEAAVEGVEYTHFQATPWQNGYEAAVSIFANSQSEYNEFKRIRGG